MVKRTTQSILKIQEQAVSMNPNQEIVKWLIKNPPYKLKVAFLRKELCI